MYFQFLCYVILKYNPFFPKILIFFIGAAEDVMGVITICNYYFSAGIYLFKSVRRQLLEIILPSISGTVDRTGDVEKSFKITIVYNGNHAE